MSSIKLEIHLEYPWHAVTLPETWPEVSRRWAAVLYRLLDMLDRHRVKAQFYVLGHVASHEPTLMKELVRFGHSVGSHGYWHRHGEREGDASDRLARKFLPEGGGYRSPFWSTTPRPGYGGGVFFRTLPYWMVKREVARTGVCYLHPHDLEPSGEGSLRRRLFWCNPWERLERLLTEVAFERR